MVVPLSECQVKVSIDMQQEQWAAGSHGALENKRLMANQIRQCVAEQMVSALHQCGLKDVCPRKLAWCARFMYVKKNTDVNDFNLSLPYKHIIPAGILPIQPWEELMKQTTAVAKQAPCSFPISHIHARSLAISIRMDLGHIKKCVLNEIISQKSKYGLSSNLLQYRLDSHSRLLTEIPQNQKVLVEYSSANIAKPFHAGHLRSTILGNFIANINEALGHDVVRVNYLGDWGTQFGLLGVGYEKYGSSEELQKDAIKHLFQVYVKANKEVASGSVDVETGQTFHDEGKEFFRRMEAGDETALKLWKSFKDSSITVYQEMYERLGVKFDVTEAESDYQQKTQELVQMLRQNNIMQINNDTGQGIMDLSSPQHEGLYVVLQKSDGTSLYITRDIAALLDRHDRYKFDRAHYVVENGQHLHFLQLKEAAKRLGYDWTHSALGDDFHVKFGRVEGMSTRKGEVVLLEDILNEARDRMSELMREKKTTKVSEDEIDRVADRLGVAAVILQDLNMPRLHNYKFSWDRMTRFTGNTGVFLQYTHARLHNVESLCGVELNPDCNLDSLVEPSAMRVIIQLAKYDEVVHAAFCDNEPCHIAHYLFMLCHLVSKATKELYVRGQPADIAEARLLMFHATKVVLQNGLRLLGMEPLERM